MNRYDRQLKILEQYLKSKKQIFIAYDDHDNTNENIKEILQINSIIKRLSRFIC